MELPASAMDVGYNTICLTCLATCPLPVCVAEGLGRFTMERGQCGPSCLRISQGPLREARPVWNGGKYMRVRVKSIHGQLTEGNFNHNM